MFTTSLPQIRIEHITAQNTCADITPWWFQQEKPSHCRFPQTYDPLSIYHRRMYDCLAKYRTMTKTVSLDFSQNPFSPTIDNTEALIIVLNELLCQLDVNLCFTNQKVDYDDSTYRTACGVGDQMQNLAHHLQQQASAADNLIKQNNILQHIQPKKYDYKFEAALKHL
ncbi:unnamed protein product [Didymodactylos carnosus]|uniref:Uncharacterized protein n=1 Tax=Didymodactylos carnosus TaxID=1234261 RepID=A0A8S2MUK2_9BILA|nr:unnamed protein product [Didymodactylos carnosus]CAF3962201.1 unnamed protein product [Didymodactylos carnosus]